MNRSEAIRQLDSLRGKNVEYAHMIADEVLVEMVKENGLADVAQAWVRAKERCRFYYS